jgi:hypothetical protein
MTAGKWLKTACNLCYINCGVEVFQWHSNDAIIASR